MKEERGRKKEGKEYSHKGPEGIYYAKYYGGGRGDGRGEKIKKGKIPGPKLQKKREKGLKNASFWHINSKMNLKRVGGGDDRNARYISLNGGKLPFHAFIRVAWF